MPRSQFSSITGSQRAGPGSILYWTDTVFRANRRLDRNTGDDMRRFSIMLAITAAAFGLAGCSVEPVDSAAQGATPPIEHPIGPLPGPAQAGPGSTNPFLGNAVAASQGRQFFVRYNCYGCHGGRGGGGMGPSLRDETWIYGSSDAEIYSSIAQGRANGMPSWGRMLPQEQIWKIVAYVKSMRTAQEPDKPETR